MFLFVLVLYLLLTIIILSTKQNQSLLKTVEQEVQMLLDLKLQFLSFALAQVRTLYARNNILNCGREKISG